MARQNPWALVSAADYERHMGPDGADQLRPLAAILGRALADLRPRRLLVLGVATGNGLEHVDPAVTERAVGVDVNIQYLAIARQRFARLGPRLELFCAELEKVQLAEGSFDLVWAGLVLEYADLGVAVPRIAGWLAPGGSLVLALQLPSAGGHAVPTGVGSMEALGRDMRLVPPEELEDLLAGAGLAPRQRVEVPVPRGGSFFVARWVRPK